MKYYDEKYFNWQKNIGAFGGKANLFKFENHIEIDSKLVDFGSGGGYLLSNINIKDKVGIEINATARNAANEMGIKTYSSTDEIEDN